jgi:hypothetical protein
MFCSGDDASGPAVATGLSGTAGRYPGGSPRRVAQRWLAAISAVPAGLALLIAFPGQSQASIGVGVQSVPVRLASVAQPGDSYSFAPVYIVNTGTQDESISMRVQRFSHGPGRTVPPSWIHFSGNGMRLAARSSARVPLELVVPAGAEPGKYLSDVVVAGTAGIVVGKANLGVAAATKLEFTVGRGSGHGLAFPPWTRWTLGLLLLLAAAIFAFRVSGLQIRVMRKPVSSNAIDLRGGYRDNSSA